MSKSLHGVFPPIVTPFDDEERPDLAALEFNFQRWNKTGLAGYVILGSNGEGVYMSQSERERVLAACRERIPEDMTYIAGTGAESTAVTIERTRRAAELGADYALVLTPNYYRGMMNPARLAEHFRRVADASPIPTLLYNVPANSGLNLPHGTVVELAGHPNIVGIKDSSGDVPQLSEIIRLTPDDFTVIQGSSKAYHFGLLAGADGAIVAVANALPKSTVAIFQAAQSGDMETLNRLGRMMIPFGWLTTASQGVPALKAAMGLTGYKGGRVRSPLTPLTDDKTLAELRELVGFFKDIEEG